MRAAAITVSVASHALFLLLVLVAPLLESGALPRLEAYNVILAPPPPLPPPAPPPPPAAPKSNEAVRARIKPVRTRPQDLSGRLAAPVEIPEELPEESLSDAPLELDFEGGMIGGFKGGIPGGVISTATPPRLVKRVVPVYPEVARQSLVKGIVILQATTDVFGRVQNILVLRSIPLLDQAAIDAVRQWIYEPMLVNGRPFGVTFTVLVRFELK